MTCMDLKELTPRHQEQHALRLLHLKESVAARQYDIGSTQIAGSMIREALTYATWHRRLR